MADPVLDYLGSHSLLTLATASKNGIPHAAPVIYVNDGTTVYFSIAPASTSASNLSENPVAAIGVADNPDDWNAAQGAQLVGNVTKLSGADAKLAAGLFTQRFSNLGDAVDQAPFYRLQPHDVRYVDNKSSSGEKNEALGQSWVTNVVHRVFRHLRPDEVDSLSKKFSKESFKSGTTMIEQGTAGDRFYLIVDGVARTTRGARISTSGPGGFVGGSIADPRTATGGRDRHERAVAVEGRLRVGDAGVADLRRDFDVVVASARARHDLTPHLEQDAPSPPRWPRTLPARWPSSSRVVVIGSACVQHPEPPPPPTAEKRSTTCRWSTAARRSRRASTPTTWAGKRTLACRRRRRSCAATCHVHAADRSVRSCGQGPGAARHGGRPRVRLATTIGAGDRRDQRTTNVVTTTSATALVAGATGELAFSPPALIVPAEQIGKGGRRRDGGTSVHGRGKVIQRPRPIGSTTASVRVSSAVGESTSRSRTMACAGIGIASSSRRNGSSSTSTSERDDAVHRWRSPTPPAAVASLRPGGSRSAASARHPHRVDLAADVPRAVPPSILVRRARRSVAAGHS
jgi:uncharacterized protein YhbP (UPF0306 family)